MSSGSVPGKRSEGAAGHLYLVGLAGSGKSTVGPALAKRLSREFIDLDQEIVRREGMTVGEIFRAKGEPYFRAREVELTLELAVRTPAVVAPGAGWIMTPGVRELAQGSGRIVYLRVRPETALSRVGSEKTHRPLLDRPDALEELGRQLITRGPTYEMADLVVDAETLLPQEVIDCILGAFWTSA
jgi:3-dehydroquinate synthase